MSVRVVEMTDAGGKEPRKHITPEDFALACEQSSSLEEVAKRLRLSVEQVKARHADYKKRGVLIKDFPRRPKRTVDVDTLNAYIQKIRQEEAEKERAQRAVQELREGDESSFPPNRVKDRLDQPSPSKGRKKS